MRLSARRLEALIEAAGRGIDEWEAEDDDETNGDIEAAREGLRYLYEIRRKREVAKVAFRNATDEEKAAVIAWARKA